MHSIVNGQCPVMRHDLSRHPLTQLPQEMIHFHCDTYDTQLLIYVLLYHFHRNYFYSSNLNIFLTSATQLHLTLNLLLQLLRVFHYLVLVQDLRHSLICEHRQLINVIKLPQSLTIVHTPNCCHQKLRPLVKVSLMSSVNCMVLEIREIPSQYVY